MCAALNTFASMSNPAKIFIIYAREDVSIRDELVKALSPLQLQHWVESWHDGNILPGGTWDEEIRHHLEIADIILPIISSDYFASEHVRKVEIERAFARSGAGECRIVPVIARACEWESDHRLSQLQVLPPGGKAVGSWENRDEAFKSIAAGIKQLVRPDAKQETVTDLPWQKVSIWERYRVLIIALVLLSVVATIALFMQQPKPRSSGAPSKEQMDSLEQAGFQNAVNQHSIPALQSFLRQYPNGLKSEAAKKAMDILQIEVDFNTKSALALYNGGEIQGAYSAFEKAFKISPNDPNVLNLQEKLKNK